MTKWGVNAIPETKNVLPIRDSATDWKKKQTGHKSYTPREKNPLRCRGGENPKGHVYRRLLGVV